jgi:hypothetical protein
MKMEIDYQPSQGAGHACQKQAAVLCLKPMKIPDDQRSDCC